MKKLKSFFKKYGARIGAFAMCFMLLIPMLCSMASPSGQFELTIQNPDNIPQDYSIEYYIFDGGMDEVGKPLAFGTNTAFGLLTNGNLEGEQLVPYGNYAMIYVVGSNVGGGTALTCNGTAYNLIPDYSINAYVTDNPVISVTDDYAEDDSGLFIFVPIETPTSSITSVWTSITNWVISSLNTVQGVFYGAVEEVIVPDTTSTDTVVYNGVTYYPIDNASAESSDYGLMYFDGSPVNTDLISQVIINIDGTDYRSIVYLGNTILIVNPVTFDIFSPVGLEFVIQSDGALTLLGTLAVIGLSISLAFLLIGIIQRFLRPRG